MQFTIVASLLSLASMASAAAIPASKAPTRMGPLSFIVTSTDKNFNGKWLAPADTTTADGRTTATLSAKRFRTFFISEQGELQFTATQQGTSQTSVTKSAKINDYLQVIPLLAPVTFEKFVKSEEEGAFGVAEKSFSAENGLTVRGGKQWYACNNADKTVSVKVLVSGTQPSAADSKRCAKISLEAVDGIAK